MSDETELLKLAALLDTLRRNLSPFSLKVAAARLLVDVAEAGEAEAEPIGREKTFEDCVSTARELMVKRGDKG